MKLKHCGLLTFYKDFFEGNGAMGQFPNTSTDPSIDEFVADVNEFRNIDQYFRCMANPDKTEYEILEYNSFG